ncbi:MAG: hypothetical protein FWE44_06615, partial [Defluviitaleaceae bacterium]|nr:hypothetical protein [Defluviitaleaceae bacterium]
LISPTGTCENVDMATDIEVRAKKTLESPIFGTSIYHILTSKKGLSEFFVREGLTAKLDEETLDEFYLSAHAGGIGGKYSAAALLSKLFNTSIKTTLDELTTPHRIITGSITPNSQLFALWKELGEDTAAMMVEDAHLLPHLDKPEEFLAAFREI